MLPINSASGHPIKLFVFLTFIYYMPQHSNGGQRTTCVCVWGGGSVLSFRHGGFGDGNQAVRLDSKHFYLQSHFAGPSILKFRSLDIWFLLCIYSVAKVSLDYISLLLSFIVIDSLFQKIMWICSEQDIPTHPVTFPGDTWTNKGRQTKAAIPPELKLPNQCIYWCFL